MKSIRLLDRRAAYSLSSLGLLLGIVAPAALPAFASADVLTSRSITMSNSKADADGVSYKVNFTGTANIGATSAHEGGVVIDFCSESPLIGTDCTTPTGFSAAGAAVVASSVIYAGNTGSPAANGTVTASAGRVVWTPGDAYTGGATFEMSLSGINNPTDPGTFYARITTFSADMGTPPAANAMTGYDDSGAVALSANDEFGVTAYVMESMTFCVSKGAVGHIGALTDVSDTAEPSENCGGNEAGGCAVYQAGCVVDPTMTLGQKVGGSGSILALDTGNVSTGSLYAQLSTNANGGASVRLRSGATTCNGLYLNGIDDASHCGIPAQTTAATGIAAGTAGFGLTVGTAGPAPLAAGTAGSGTDGQYITPGTGYEDTLAYLEDGATGVLSAYGTELFTASQPVNNVNVPITFNATVGNTTPAGSYGAKFDMIATGTF